MFLLSELTLSQLTSVQTLFALGFGAIIGSFLNVCILRIPNGTFLANTRSICFHCKKPIPFYLNIPILSFAVLRGRSACCQQRLPWQYPLVELASALLFAFFYLKYPFGGHAALGAIDYEMFRRFIHAAVFSSLLLVCSVIDIHHMIIPDVISLPMVALTPLVVYFHPELDWLSATIGVIAGGGILYAVAWLYWLTRKEVGMGLGDVKLLAAIGGWLGYQSILPTILIGSVSGSVIGLLLMAFGRKLDMKSSIPFGPFLAIGAILHLATDGSILGLWVRH